MEAIKYYLIETYTQLNTWVYIQFSFLNDLGLITSSAFLHINIPQNRDLNVWHVSMTTLCCIVLLKLSERMVLSLHSACVKNAL